MKQPWPARIAGSATFRFAALVFALQLLSIAAILLTVTQLTRNELIGDSRALATELMTDLLSTRAQGGDRALAENVSARAARNDDTVILLARPDGAAITGNLGAWPPTVTPQTGWRTIDLYRIGHRTPESMGIVATRLPNGMRLLAGHVVETNLRLGRIVEGSVLGALALSLPLALLGAFVALKLISGRLRRITATAQAVSGGDLTRRVSPDGSGDAFESLGLSINIMLDRIEGLVSELRIVTDGLAHDLRSPLTRLKATLERSAGETGDRKAQAAFSTALIEADTLLAMLSTALQISRAEAGIGRDRFAMTDIGAMLDDLVELYGPVAEERGFAIDLSAPAGLVVPAHRELLGQAIANLIDNALKYGAGRIAMAARATAEGVEISVADDGPGIPADRREEALRRFGRLDSARHVGGAGLGLALVAAVARLHGGGVSLAENHPGLRASFMLAGAATP